MMNWSNVASRMLERPGGWFRRFGANIAAGFGLLGRERRPVPAAFANHFSWPHIAVGALLVVVIAIWQAILFDMGAIRAARRLPDWFVIVMNWLTDFGKSGWILWPLGLALIALAAVAASRNLSPLARRTLAALAIRFEFLFLAIAAPGLFATTVKRMIGRARPFVGGEADAFLYRPFDWTPAFASMPSGHATTAVAAAVAVGALWPRARFWMWGYAVVIGLSRVVVLAHHPSDVAAGAVVGALGALLVRNAFAARRLAFTVGEGGIVHAMPGPTLGRIKRVARAIAGP